MSSPPASAFPRQRAHARLAPRSVHSRLLDGEAAGPEPVGGVDLAVRAEPLEPVTMVGAEDQGEKLDRLQAPGEVTELSRELGRDTAGDRGRLVGGMQRTSARGPGRRLLGPAQQARSSSNAP